MPPETAPDEIIALADARAAARRAGDWPTADRLKAEIEAAGWKVVDAASLYSLERVAPAVVMDRGLTRYGASGAVPSRLDQAPVGVASVILQTTDDPADVARTLRGLTDSAPDGTQVVIVANAPSEPQAAALLEVDAGDPGAPGIMTEVVWTSTRLGVAAAWNAGIRRAVAPVVVLLGPRTEVLGDVVGAIVAALEDHTVAVAGPVGLLSRDLRAFLEAPADTVDVHAIGGAAIGFRRADYVARGPLDEQFLVADSLDTWWSLTLRDPWAAVDDPDTAADDEATVERADETLVDLSDLPPPRRAVQVAAGLVRHQPPADPATRDRLSRRAFYRYLKYFATRRDLLTTSG